MDPESTVPEPMRDNTGSTDLGPRNIELDRQNPDILTPPSTDSGTLPNLKFSFALAHNRLQDGGWTRQVTVRELPIATTLAGVNMRLNPGGVRELHWHKEAEWAYMLNGLARISAVDQDGCNFLDDVGVGDLWYFPPGIPHSIQGLEEGCEFLLVFDNGSFSEDSTFLITDWFAHTPKEVLAKNFGLTEVDFVSIPLHELDHRYYMFPIKVPGPLSSDKVDNNQGQRSFSYRLLDQKPLRTSGGTARIVDSTNFPVATNIAAGLVEVEPGGMREMHWHPNTDKWQYFIEGTARMGVFASEGKSRTFDYRSGDVGYVPFAMGHYIENTGDTPLRFLEMFKSPRFQDVSLNQWMALTPPELVKAHLNLNHTVMGSLRKEKWPVIKNSNIESSEYRRGA
jgi:oxalate decarboxylase